MHSCVLHPPSHNDQQMLLGYLEYKCDKVYESLYMGIKCYVFDYMECGNIALYIADQHVFYTTWTHMGQS